MRSELLPFDRLVGLTIAKINNDNNEIIFESSAGQKYTMKHEQDCCEHVYVEDIVGDLEDLIDTPIIVADERSERDPNPTSNDSGTWTFYEIRTIKGSVTIRWYGSSNGYYSESVNLYEG